MSAVMEEGIKHWTARRKSALVLEIIQGKTTVAEASGQFDIPPSEIESWAEDGKRGMENALRAKPEDCAGAECWSCAREKIGVPAGQGRDLMVAIQQGTAGGRVGRLDGEAVPLVWGGAAQRVLPADEGTAQSQAGVG